MSAFEGPFSTFNFRVSLRLEGESHDLCAAEFSEVDGLEMTIEPKTIREGGNNAQPIHLMGKVSYGQLTLKRGLGRDQGLWSWFERTASGEYGLRANGRIEVLSTDRASGSSQGPRTDATFVLTGCFPLKVRAPALNAKDGELAIEEMQLAFETMRRERERS
ncbi:phage tail protein [Myxococcota bacterium]|nr:phage tail protein [Myxococcota bacterium]